MAVKKSALYNSLAFMAKTTQRNQSHEPPAIYLITTSIRSNSPSDGAFPSVPPERWRAIGWGPLFLKIGGRVVYRAEDILAYEEQHLADSTQSRVYTPSRHQIYIYGVAGGYQ